MRGRNLAPPRQDIRQESQTTVDWIRPKGKRYHLLNVGRYRRLRQPLPVYFPMAERRERWLFTNDQLINSPSQKCGIDAPAELSYRQQAACLISDIGQKLELYALPFFRSQNCPVAEDTCQIWIFPLRNWVRCLNGCGHISGQVAVTECSQLITRSTRHRQSLKEMNS